jgi:hypothetical protein
MRDLVCKIGHGAAQRGRVGMRDSRNEVKTNTNGVGAESSRDGIDPAERLHHQPPYSNCERWKKGLVELQHVIRTHSSFLLALTGDIGRPVPLMLKHLPHPLPAL